MRHPQGIKFPAIGLVRNGWLLPYLDAKDMNVVDWESVRRRSLVGASVVDSAGTLLLVKGARFAGWPGLLRGFSLLRKRAALVELDFSDEHLQLSLKEFQTTLISHLKLQQSHWEAAKDLDAWGASIVRTTSFEEAIRLFV
jgi:hypothetical protein